MTDNRIVQITIPKCGTCRFFGAEVDKNRMAFCYGVPPTPMLLGATPDALGRPQLHLEAITPKVKDDRPACHLHVAKQDFATAGRS